MGKEDNQNNLGESVNYFSKGLSVDTGFLNQPKGSYSFCLNGVNESIEGDLGKISNEESNEVVTYLKSGYTPIGKVYIGNNTTVILSCSTVEGFSVSEIGLLDKSFNYTVLVNDENSPLNKKLNFKVSSQIQAVYRLRRGCERTIYFVGKDYPVRYYNIDKPNQFKTNNLWDSTKFDLFKKVRNKPAIDKVEILNTEGSLLPGSYSILVQHLDEDLNATEFIELIRDINIYNESLDSLYYDIEGSVQVKDTPMYSFGNTSKAISISLENVDKAFSYIRYAFVERTSGNGQISSVKYSDNLPISSTSFTYTGLNASSNGTIEEVQLFNANYGLQSAQHIEQIDNMLVLANVQGGQEEICKLQQYASRIKTDCFIKDIILTSVKESHNSKNPLVHYNGVGYQPGEIYSLGIVYVFEDNTLSPVMHIPGKSLAAPLNKVYNPDSDTYPMSNVDNKNLSEIYSESNSTCPSSDYWGKDCEGVALKNTNVRHHRFPTRDSVGVGFVKRKKSIGGIATFKYLTLRMDMHPTIGTPNFKIKVKYLLNGVERIFSNAIYTDISTNTILVQSDIYNDSDTISGIQVFYIEQGSLTETLLPLTDGSTDILTNGSKFKINIGEFKENNTQHIYEVPIFGFKFSNIVLPSEKEVGKKVVGYHIVRQERREQDKTILDAGVVFPMMKSGGNVTTAMLTPEFWDNNWNPSLCEGSEQNIYPTCYNISKRNLMLLSPAHKFMDKTFDDFTTIKQVGSFDSEYYSRSATSTQDIYEGTSASGDEDSSTKDDDGYTLRHGYRFVGVVYNDIVGTPLEIKSLQTRMYNLEAVNYAITQDSAETLYNLSSDNKALVLSSTKSGVNLTTYGPNRHKFPYVYIHKEHKTFYQNHRDNSYFLVSAEQFSNSTCKVFGGDTHIVPMRHSNHIFGGAVAAIRRKKTSAWSLVGSILTILVGIALTAIIGPASLLGVAAILTAVGGAAMLTATLLDVAKFSEIYGEKWKDNLDRTVLDFPFARLFIREHPEEDQPSYNPDQLHQPWADDTFRWWGEVVGDLWFETPLNLSLRVHPKDSTKRNYLAPLKSYMNDKTQQLLNCSDTEYLSNQTPWGGENLRRYFDEEFAVDGEVEWYFIKKITEPQNNGQKLHYTGMSLPVVYYLNQDYHIISGIKSFYAIPIEYDCCSECREYFPHRVHYSQQAFQEEKSDNYRMFLPNNYKDIEGETGEITNMIRIGNNLFVHTAEALWQMGRSYQERVTDNIVSFIGTGSYFEIPPQKILDDSTGSSAGTRHKWGTMKTSVGYFFVSENQAKVYQLGSGKGLKEISQIGLNSWFKNNLPIQLDKTFYKDNKTKYPYENNPSNILGTGFIMTYDTQKERLILTKKDLLLTKSIKKNDSEFKVGNNAITIFEDMSRTISTQSARGWLYDGIIDNRMQFSKYKEEQSDEDFENTGEVKDYSYISGREISTVESVEQELCWTISYSLKNNSWVSYHSYLPNFYINVPESFFSWKHGVNGIWKHGAQGSYQKFYNILQPHVIEYVSNKTPLVTRVWDYLQLQTNCKVYDNSLKEFIEDTNTTFNKAILYNTRQCSGELDLVVKQEDLGGTDYMINQVVNTNSNMVILDKNERDWFINDLRDIRVDYNKPIWNSSSEAVKPYTYIDKVLNTSTLDVNKDWTQLESFRDKYLVIRLIFDKFADKKLITNFSVENEQQSFY